MNTHLRRLFLILTILAVVHLNSLEIWAADIDSSQPLSSVATERNSIAKVDEFDLTYVTVTQLDLRTMIDIPAKQLDSALLHLLEGRAEEFVQMAEEYQINIYFICAVAAVESGWGRDYYATHQNNYFGIMKGNDYATYDDFEDSLASFCNLIDESYLSDEGQYYCGYTVSAVAKNYNGLHAKSWISLVEEIMVQIHERALVYEGEESK